MQKMERRKFCRHFGHLEVNAIFSWFPININYFYAYLRWYSRSEQEI